MLENIQYIDSASISNLAVTAETVMNTLFATSVSCSVITASLFFGTASVATNSISASYLSGTIAIATNITSSNIVLSNYVTNPLSAATNSNIIGYQAGSGSNGSDNNFIGYQAGAGAGATSNAVFIGYQVGVSSSVANNSVFIGTGQTGYSSPSASNSIFIGYSSGYTANSASGSVFIGYTVGNFANNAYYSNFIGYFAGGSATNAANSNFIGYYAGYNASNANNSIFIGYQAGYTDTINNSGNHSSILIGDYTKTGGWRDSIAIGKGTMNSAMNQANIGNCLFINNIYSSSTATSTPQANAQVGIGTYAITNSLDVIGNISCSVITASLFNGTASFALNGGGGLSGGVTNYVPLWTSANTLSTSSISQSVSGSININQPAIQLVNNAASTLPALTVNAYWSASNSTAYSSLIQGTAYWSGSSVNNGNQYLLNLQTFNSASIPNNNQFKVSAGGSITMGSTNQPCMMQFGNSILQFGANGGTTVDMELANNGGYTLNVGSGCTFGWASTAAAGGLSGVDTRLVRDAANTIAIRNGGVSSASVPQAFNLYNYYTSATDKQYVSNYWTGSNYYIQLVNTGSANTGSTLNFIGTASYALNSISTSYFSGSISTAVNSTNASSASIQTESQGGIYYFTIVTASSGPQPLYVDVTDLQFNQATQTAIFTNISASTISSSIVTASGIRLNGTASFGNAVNNSVVQIYSDVSADTFYMKRGSGGTALALLLLDTASNRVAGFLGDNNAGTYAYVPNQYPFFSIVNSANTLENFQAYTVTLSSGSMPTTVIPTNMLTVNGNISCSVITASLFYGTASYASNANATLTTGGAYAITASWATSSISASYLSGTTAIVTTLTSSNIVVANYIVNATVGIGPNSNIIGSQAGGGGTGPTNNFIGSQAGYQAYVVSGSNFIGSQAGYQAFSASFSNFIGGSTGASATNANNSIFIGSSAGGYATNASQSIFIGSSAGVNSLNAGYSTFIGYNAGNGAVTARFSTFIGYNAGNFAPHANNSIFIGYQSGYNDTVNNSAGPNSSILIGDYTLTNGYSDSISIGKGTSNTTSSQANIGNSLYINGIYTGSTTNSSSQPNVRVGIGTYAITNSLDVIGNISCSIITASLFYGTSSYALTSSNYNGATLVVNTVTISSGSININNGPSTPFYISNNSANKVSQLVLNAGYSTGGGSAQFSNNLGNTVGIDASGSLSASFGLYVSGSIFGSVTGSLLGTASYTLTASYFSGSIITSSFATALNFFALDGITYSQYVPTGSLVPDIYFTGSATTGSDSVMGVYQTVATGSSIGIIINMVSLSSGNAIAISASAGSIIATSFTGSLLGTSSYAFTSSYTLNASASISSSYTTGTASYSTAASSSVFAATSSWPWFPVSSTAIETTQFVGININPPLQPLHVYGPLLVEGSPTPRIYAKSNDGGNSLVFDRYTGQSNYSMFFGETADTGATYFRGQGGFYFGGSNPALFCSGSTGKVGVNNVTNPINSLDVGGNISCSVITASIILGQSHVYNITRSTTNYAIQLTDSTILMSGSAALSASLPSVTTVPTGIEYTIKNLSTYQVTITGSQKIDNQQTQVITGQYTSVTVQSDGTAWWII